MLESSYLTIRSRFPQAVEGEEAEVTLSELTAWLHFTSRNVNLILRKMEEAGWLRWLPGRGRGHRSRLVFLVSSESLALKPAQEYVNKGDLQAAFAWIEKHSYLPALRDQFAYWLDSHFGYRTGGHDEGAGDTLRIPYNKPVSCLDPPFITFVVESHLAKQLFDTLVKYNQQTGTIEPHLAHHWCRNEHGTEWTFYLRKGVLFHHGREMTSQDVKFTLERIIQEGVSSPYHWMLEDIAQVEPVSRYTLSINLKRPNSLFLHSLGFDRASIVPEDAVRSMGERFKRSPVGTGPFQIVRHDNNMLVCEAFSRYFDKRAHLDRIEIWYTPELECKSSRVERTMHRIRTPGTEELPEQTGSTVDVISGGCSKLLTFNGRLPGPQQRLAFRQAVIHGIDRTRCELLSRPDEAILADWLIPPKAADAPSVEDKLYDPELAARLLKESGYNGEVLRMAVSQATLRESEALQKLLGEMGVRIQLEEISDDYWQRLEAVNRCHLCLYAIVLDDDLILSVLEVFLAENSFVKRHLNDESLLELEPLIRELYSSDPSLEKLASLERLIKRHAAVFFLYHWQQKTSYHPSLRGVSLNNLGWVPFRDIWFEPLIRPAQAQESIRSG
ncbi:ABC transporter substrate-binding protein [Paenibacillus sp. TAB 01]|uniref:ABC transporter substrate-binding protein n=1 Tax=Paenibacillus sp. TAB 01 TaxID=3368988 RepID=UPI003750B9D3